MKLPRFQAIGEKIDRDFDLRDEEERKAVANLVIERKAEHPTVHPNLLLLCKAMPGDQLPPMLRDEQPAGIIEKAEAPK